MTIKRTKDPTGGIFGDQVSIENPKSKGDISAAFDLLKRNSPKARIEALRDTPELATKADELNQWLDDLSGKANAALLSAIQDAEARRVQFKSIPEIIAGQNYKKSQREKSRKRRPGAHSQLKEKIIALMGPYKNDGANFETFLQAWRREALNGLRLTCVNPKDQAGKQVFAIDDENGSAEKIERKIGTLRRYWVSIKKN